MPMRPTKRRDAVFAGKHLMAHGDDRESHDQFYEETDLLIGIRNIGSKDQVITVTQVAMVKV
jgi:hypothetical protein